VTRIPAEAGLDAGGGRVRRLADTFEAFYELHQESWLRFALAQVGGREAAEQIVDGVTNHLADSWKHVLHQHNVERYAWAVLKTFIERWLNDHGARPAFVETSAFDRVAQAMNYSKEQFGLMEESLGLYSAIRGLSERQHDVIVLRYVLGYSDQRVGFLLGIDPKTVRSHVRFAKQRLARQLGIEYKQEDED
jgi:RNA polymerase sigma-70 factor (ECF subfamily)